MSSGEVREFKSTAARERFEKYVQAMKHGWKPTRKYKKSNKYKKHGK